MVTNNMRIDESEFDPCIGKERHSKSAIIKFGEQVKIYDAWYDEKGGNLIHEASAQEIDDRPKRGMPSLKLEKQRYSEPRK